MKEEPIEVYASPHFETRLQEIISHPECREEILRTIRFQVRIPGLSKYVGIAAPIAIPVYALSLLESAFGPAMVVSFMRTQDRIVLMNVRVAERFE